MKMMLRALILGFILLSTADVYADEVSWFTDTPPNREMMKKMRFAHGGPVEMGRGGLYIKSLWLRSGTSPGRSEFSLHASSDDPAIILHSPDGKVSDVVPVKNRQGYGFRFEMPQEGFYNLYLVERFVEGDVLNVVVTKAEVLKHNCSKGHDHVLENMPPKSFEEIPFELLRERIPGEDFHTNISSGDDVTFKVLYKRRPAFNADVKFITRKGWAKSAITDMNGNVTYELIRDHYPSIWSKFEKRKSEDSIVVAEYRVEEKGIYKGKHFDRIRYVSTLPGKYYPSKQEYTSYVYGLSLLAFTLAFSAAGAYIYRSRREKPYREETFFEGD